MSMHKMMVKEQNCSTQNKTSTKMDITSCNPHPAIHDLIDIANHRNNFYQSTMPNNSAGPTSKII